MCAVAVHGVHVWWGKITSNRAQSILIVHIMGGENVGIGFRVSNILLVNVISSEGNQQ